MITFFQEGDLQLAANALKAARYAMAIKQGASENKQALEKATDLARSSLIQGGALEELILFMGEASKLNFQTDQLITTLLA